MSVESFLQSQANVPFQYGVSDCCLFIADYVLDVDGVDHATDLRNSYSTKAGAHRVMTKNGGLHGLMDRSGWSRTYEPQDGAIVIIGDSPLLPAIKQGDKFYFKAGTGGVAFVTHPICGPAWEA